MTSCLKFFILILITIGSASGFQIPASFESDNATTQDLYMDSCLLARSNEEKDLHELELRLCTREFLNNLDSEEAYSGPAIRLRVAGILQILCHNTSKSARRLLLNLTSSTTFMAHRARVELLVRSLVLFEPAPTEVIEFWDQHFQPEDGYSSVTAGILLENGSEPAISLFEKKLKNVNFPATEREFWITGLVLQHRNNFNLLRACSRLLESSLEKEYKLLLVDVLFDYKPGKWYGAGYRYKPPPRSQADKQSLCLLNQIGEKVLNTQPLKRSQKRKIQDVIKNLSD